MQSPYDEKDDMVECDSASEGIVQRSGTPRPELKNARSILQGDANKEYIMKKLKDFAFKSQKEDKRTKSHFKGRNRRRCTHICVFCGHVAVATPNLLHETARHWHHG